MKGSESEREIKKEEDDLFKIDQVIKKIQDAEDNKNTIDMTNIREEVSQKLTKYNKKASVLSLYDAPIGHNRNDVIVPLFPLYTHQQMFKKSLELGYDYEDIDENGTYIYVLVQTV